MVKGKSELAETKAAAILEVEQLSHYNADLYQSCDFVMKNFDVWSRHWKEQKLSFQSDIGKEVRMKTGEEGTEFKERVKAGRSAR